ncbi:hypothetical protein AAEU33_09235 [Chryseobacterium sp. Chry.R1]|uniref:hypothetical protein n=1 Tax=Chryseobacterium sp. Chry.R1 TaxID=3139392 RepID=UPI0031F7CFC4
MLRKYRISVLFLCGLFIWSAIIIFRKNGIIIPWFNDYFTDLITVPMYGYLIQYGMNKILGFRWQPDLKFIISSVIYLSLLFEWFCPLVSDHFVGDFFDVLAYSIGGIGYYLFQHKKVPG